MILAIILSVFATAALSIYCTHTTDDNWEFDFIMSVLLPLALGLLVFCISTIVSYFAISSEMTLNTLDRYGYSTTERELVALSDGLSIDGRCFLLFGYLDGDLEYRYLYEEDGYFKQGSALAEEVCLVYCEDGEVPKIIEYEAEAFNNASDYWFKWPRGKISIFMVPRDSITCTYSVDLQ